MGRLGVDLTSMLAVRVLRAGVCFNAQNRRVWVFFLFGTIRRSTILRVPDLRFWRCRRFSCSVVICCVVGRFQGLCAGLVSKNVVVITTVYVKIVGPHRHWADLEGLHIYHLSFYFFRTEPKKRSTPNGPYKWSPGLTVGAQTALFFEPGPFPGPAVGPRGRKSAKKRGRIYRFIVPKVCPGHPCFLRLACPRLASTSGGLPPPRPPTHAVPRMRRGWV